ncbi:MAG: PorV/PorQ family protein, partial [Bacteroidetes bacterium]
MSVFSQAGNTGLSFLKLGLGSRAVSMGETFVVANSEPSSVNYNPASLALSATTQAVFSHREWIQDTRSEFLGASSYIGDLAVGFGLHSVSISDIELRTTPGPAEGTFDAKNVSIGIAAAYQLTSELSLGVAANYLFEKILVDEASGYGINFGAVYATPWDVRLGLAVDHIGSMNELNMTASTLPTT